MKTKASFEELVDREARRLAIEKLEHELAVQDLPLPRDSAIDVHIAQILRRDPSIRERAAQLVEARADAYTEGLRAIGVIAGPLDIELKI